MLSELILREERTESFTFLIALGFLSALLGYLAATLFFPGRESLVSVFFASIPLIYPLTQKLLEDEKQKEAKIDYLDYGSLLLGEAGAFMVLGLFFPESFANQTIVTATGYATVEASFMSVSLNNLMVFSIILAVSGLIGSAGAFILTWNASVLGVFFSKLVRDLKGVEQLLSCKAGSPLCYVPHASLEISGFVIAGIAGTMISTSTYRRDFEKEVWKRHVKLVLIGIAAILLGALLETA